MTDGPSFAASGGRITITSTTVGTDIVAEPSDSGLALWLRHAWPHLVRLAEWSTYVGSAGTAGRVLVGAAALLEDVGNLRFVLSDLVRLALAGGITWAVAR